MKEFDISGELYRTYVYDDGYEIRIDEVSKLFVSDRGSHRVLRKGGQVVYVRSDWRCIIWLPRDPANPVAF